MFSLMSPWFEAEALSAPTKLRVAIEDTDNRPYSYRQDDKWIGFHIEVIEAVTKRLHWEVEWVPITWSKSYNTLFIDKADAINFLMRTPVRNEPNVFFNPDNIISYFEIAVYARNDSPKISLARKNFSHLANYHIGVVPGSIADRWFNIVYPEVVLNRSPQDSLQLFQMLDTKRFDFVIANEYSFDVATSVNPKLKDSIKKLKPQLTEAPAYIAFQNTEHGRKLAEEFGNVFKTFRGNKEFKALKVKYNVR